MTQPALLLIDATYLCHRAFHTTGGLSYQGESTGIAFGFFRDILTLRSRFGEDSRFVFCFDYGRPKRIDLDSRYKANRTTKRREMTDVERANYKGFQHQIKVLRSTHLPSLGFNNIFIQQGYEADDLIAALCLREAGDKIIVSADSDLYQLLSKQTLMYNLVRKQLMDAAAFSTEFGIDPALWPDVKALAGDSVDNVIGIDGVGVKTAVKFLSGKLPSKSKAYAKIVADNGRWRKNLRLVRLPLDGCDPPALEEDRVTETKWNKVMALLGITSIRRKGKE